MNENIPDISRLIIENREGRVAQPNLYGLFVRSASYLQARGYPSFFSEENLKAKREEVSSYLGKMDMMTPEKFYSMIVSASQRLRQPYIPLFILAAADLNSFNFS